MREKLSNERVWWVGSTCRPTLARVSDEQWRVSDEQRDGTVKDFKTVIKLVMRAMAAIQEAQRQG